MNFLYKMVLKYKKNILYLVTDRSGCDMVRFRNVITDAARAGVDIVQLREKNVAFQEYKEIAKEVKEITDRYHIPLIINDDPFVASEINAAGLHIGQNDISITEARNIIGKKAILGISIENIEQATSLPQHLVDYAVISPIFATTTKEDASTPVGVENTKKIRAIIKKPLFAIGGIDIYNARKAMLCGLDGLCVVSAIFHSSNHFKAARELKEKINDGC